MSKMDSARRSRPPGLPGRMMTVTSQRGIRLGAESPVSGESRAVTEALTDRDRALGELETTARMMEEYRDKSLELQKKLDALQEKHREAVLDLDKERGRTLSAQSGALAAAQPHLADLDVRKMDLSSGLREQLEKALNDLNGVRFEVEGGAGAGPGPAEATSKAPSKAKKGKSKESLVLVVQKSQQLQEKLDQAKTIMKKLYRRNVELEKEVRAMRTAQGKGPAKGQRVVAHVRGAGEQGDGVEGDGDVAEALADKNRTIAQLSAALEAARNRGALAEMAADNLRRQLRAAKGQKVTASRVSSLGSQQYENLRRQYVRLLNSKMQVAQGAVLTEDSSKAIVGSMFERLVAEMREREAESALHNAVIFDLEQEVHRWHVQKTSMEARIEGYERELAERDRLDAEMDMLMAGMNARIRELERQLAASGGPRPGAQGGWAQPYGLAPPGGALGTVEEAGDVEEGAGPGAEAGPGAGASGAGPRWAEARDGAGGAAAMPAGPLGGLEGCVVESATGFERELGAGTGAGHSDGAEGGVREDGAEAGRHAEGGEGYGGGDEEAGAGWSGDEGAEELGDGGEDAEVENLGDPDEDDLDLGEAREARSWVAPKASQVEAGV